VFLAEPGDLLGRGEVADVEGVGVGGNDRVGVVVVEH
jgi:hypothetical protein